MSRGTLNRDNMYSLILVNDHEQKFLGPLMDTSLLKIDILTTSFNHKYELFNYLNEKLKLGLKPGVVHFLIHNKKNNKLISDIYYQGDKEIIDRELIRDKLRVYLENNDFQRLYLSSYLKFRGHNRLKILAHDILDGEDKKLSTLTFNLNLLFKMIDSDGKGTSKMIRDAYLKVKTYEDGRHHIYTRRSRVDEIAADNELKDRLGGGRQLTLDDFMKRR